MAKLKPNDTGGFSLISVLVAAIILSIGVVAALQLMSRVEQTVGQGREQFVAANLAQEGIELVQAIRDTNWIVTEEPAQWTGQICSPGGDDDFTGVHEFTLDSTAARNLSGLGDIQNDQLYLTDNNEYTHQTTDTPTIFRRQVSVDCSNKSGEETQSIFLKSTVFWEEGGQTQAITFSGSIYNWFSASGL